MPRVTRGNLKDWGALIDVAVGPSAPRARAIERAGNPPVLPLVVKALIDTGACSTCVDYDVIDELSLLPKGAAPLLLPGGAAPIRTPTIGDRAVTVPTFDVQLQWIGPPHVTASPALRVYAMDLSGMGVRVLVGRDVLTRCHLIYDGPADEFTFSF